MANRLNRPGPGVRSVPRRAGPVAATSVRAEGPGANGARGLGRRHILLSR